jgi:diguanylate cyclase (GGDEF)-like protein
VLANDPSEWEIIYVDIANFSAYNESYSYVEGDEMIETAALALKSAIQGRNEAGSEYEGDFLGHTGGDKFAVVVHSSRAAKVMETAERIFSDAINDFYTPADSKQGHIVTINRQGALTKSGLCALRFDVVRSSS